MYDGFLQTQGWESSYGHDQVCVARLWLLPLCHHRGSKAALVSVLGAKAEEQMFEPASR